MGCYAVNADDESTERLAEFARLLGLCFQIKDDIFDYYIVEDTVGKPTHNDLREGKITLPLLYALTREDLPENKKMLDIVSKEVLSDEDIDVLLAFARNNGGIEYSFNRMQQLRDKAAELLSTFENKEAAKDLLDLLDFIIARDR
jgi:octaprenyl-diphosphate synthase